MWTINLLVSKSIGLLLALAITLAVGATLRVLSRLNLPIFKLLNPVYNDMGKMYKRVAKSRGRGEWLAIVLTLMAIPIISLPMLVMILADTVLKKANTRQTQGKHSKHSKHKANTRQINSKVMWANTRKSKIHKRSI